MRGKATIWRGKTRDAQPCPREEQSRAGNTGAPPLPKGKWGQRNQEFGIDTYTLFSVQKSNQQGPTVEHRDLCPTF